jgi:predicted RNA binding protein YcfA (HicA-like mRNA interferase family)
LKIGKICVFYAHIGGGMVSSREIIRALERDGWREVARRGSHVQFKHPDKRGRVTVPHPKKDLPLGTVRSIEQQSGIRIL